MKHAFIIHGAYGNPNENWFQWLKKELENSGYGAYVPKFPTPINQTLEKWLNVFEKYKNRMDESSIVIGHSLGAAFLLNLLEFKKAKAAFFVSGIGGKVDNKYWEGMRTFADKKFDWKKIRENCPHFFVYHSDNDPYIPLSHAEALAKNLKTKVILIKGAGHFNKDSGYTKFERLLEDIKGIEG